MQGPAASAAPIIRQPAVPLVVVVHRTNPIADIPSADLRRAYLGLTTRLGSRGPIVLLEFAPERSRFYRQVLSMSEDRVKRHWIGRVFAGEGGSPPEEFRDVADLLRFLAAHPDAIGFLPADQIGDAVKPLTIDGRKAGDPGYLLP